jgi:hypothetical protein
LPVRGTAPSKPPWLRTRSPCRSTAWTGPSRTAFSLRLRNPGLAPVGACSVGGGRQTASLGSTLGALCTGRCRSLEGTRTDRGCPCVTAVGRCLGHVGGTAGEDGAAGSLAVMAPVDRRVGTSRMTTDSLASGDSCAAAVNLSTTAALWSKSLHRTFAGLGTRTSEHTGQDCFGHRWLEYTSNCGQSWIRELQSSK